MDDLTAKIIEGYRRLTPEQKEAFYELVKIMAEGVVLDKDHSRSETDDETGTEMPQNRPV